MPLLQKKSFVFTKKNREIVKKMGKKSSCFSRKIREIGMQNESSLFSQKIDGVQKKGENVICMYIPLANTSRVFTALFMVRNFFAM